MALMSRLDPALRKMCRKMRWLWGGRDKPSKKAGARRGEPRRKPLCPVRPLRYGPARRAPGKVECGQKSKWVAPAPQEYQAGGRWPPARNLPRHAAGTTDAHWRAGCAPQLRGRGGG